MENATPATPAVPMPPVKADDTPDSNAEELKSEAKKADDVLDPASPRGGASAGLTPFASGSYDEELKIGDGQFATQRLLSKAKPMSAKAVKLLGTSQEEVVAVGLQRKLQGASGTPDVERNILLRRLWDRPDKAFDKSKITRHSGSHLTGFMKKLQRIEEGYSKELTSLAEQYFGIDFSAAQITLGQDTCPQGHGLVKGANGGKAEYATRALCDRCNKNIATQDADSCAACGYDVCSGCLKSQPIATTFASASSINVLPKQGSVRNLLMDKSMAKFSEGGSLMAGWHALLAQTQDRGQQVKAYADRIGAALKDGQLNDCHEMLPIAASRYRQETSEGEKKLRKCERNLAGKTQKLQRCIAASKKKYKGDQADEGAWRAALSSKKHNKLKALELSVEQATQRCDQARQAYHTTIQKTLNAFEVLEYKRHATLASKVTGLFEGARQMSGKQYKKSQQAVGVIKAISKSKDLKEYVATVESGKQCPWLSAPAQGQLSYSDHQAASETMLTCQWHTAKDNGKRKQAEQKQKELDAVRKPLEDRIAKLEKQTLATVLEAFASGSLKTGCVLCSHDSTSASLVACSAPCSAGELTARPNKENQDREAFLELALRALPPDLPDSGQLLKLESKLKAIDRLMLKLRSESSSCKLSKTTRTESKDPELKRKQQGLRERFQEQFTEKKKVREEWAKAAQHFVDQVSSLELPCFLSTKPQGSKPAPIHERITRRCNYLGEYAARLLAEPRAQQSEGKQREKKASAQQPMVTSPKRRGSDIISRGCSQMRESAARLREMSPARLLEPAARVHPEGKDARSTAKAQIESALAEAGKWATARTVARSASCQAASQLATTLEPLTQVLKGQGQPLHWRDARIELYHQALEKLNDAIRHEEVLRTSIETSYPEQAVLSAVHAVREEMAVRLLNAQAMARLVERVKTDLAGWAKAEELPQTMDNLHKKWQDDTINMREKIGSTQLEVVSTKDRLRIADDEQKQQLEEKVKTLEASLGMQQEALKERHREFRQEWEHLAANAQHLRLELLLPIYWEVKTQKAPPAWVQFWAGQFDTDGLERTDINLDTYLNRERVPTNASSHLVYVASREGKRVALKVFTVAMKEKQKFLKEARLLKRLGSHPHIASVNLTFWDPKVDQVYLEMPWYARGNLASWFLEAKKKPSKEEIRIIFRQLLMGLHHIHTNGVVHCDIKPENIFLDEGPALHIKIGDFDVSHDKEERATIAITTRQTSLTVGGFTPRYMAPELLHSASSRCSEASDVYAAGLMFYDMLTGDTRPSSRIVPSLDTLEPAERELLQKWLHKDPRQRSTIPDLLAALVSLEAESKLQEMHRREAERQGASRQCCICGDDFFQADGLDCPANQPAHFACAACLSGHVQTESLKEMDQLRKAEGKVFCPLRLHGCEGKQPYELALLASRVSSEAFQSQMDAIRKVQEQKLNQETEARYNKKLKEEMELYERLSAEQRQVQQARAYIVEELLTLKCPRAQCRRAFIDFDGCFAVTCGGCGCGFCAWCLEDCGDDAHAHVARCNSNEAPRKNVYGTPAMFEHGQNARRNKLVREYLRTLGSAELQRQVMDAVRPSLRQLGLDLG